MSMSNTPSAYGWLHILLHWLIAVIVVFLFFLGLWMTSLDYYSPWYRIAPDVHKSVGVIMILLMLFRLFWRFLSGVPQALPNHQPWEKISAHFVHIFFYVALLSMFFSGYLITTAEGQALEVFGFVQIPALITDVESLEHTAQDVHETSAFIIIGVMVLHALAAIKHHVVDKDRTLLRMLGR